MLSLSPATFCHREDLSQKSYIYFKRIYQIPIDYSNCFLLCIARTWHCVASFQKFANQSTFALQPVFCLLHTSIESLKILIVDISAAKIKKNCLKTKQYIACSTIWRLKCSSRIDMLIKFSVKPHSTRLENGCVDFWNPLYWFLYNLDSPTPSPPSPVISPLALPGNIPRPETVHSPLPH